MKLGTQVYQKPGRGQKCIQIRLNLDERYTHALNFTGYAYSDHKYQLVKNILNMQTVIVTDNDLISHDDYINQLNPHVTIVFVFCPEKTKRSKYRVTSNIAFNGCGASKKRLQNAMKKLKNQGFKTRLFTSEETVLNYLAKRSQ